MADQLVHIGEVIVHGIAFDPKNGERLRAMELDKLLQSVPELFDLLEERNIDFVLVGGIAMLVYIEGRNTQDIDLILSRKALDRLPEVVLEDENPEFARGKLGELPVDFLLTENKLFDNIRKHHTVSKEFVERKLPCATVDAIVMMKLFALPSLYRQGRFQKVDLYQNDVLRLMREYDPTIKPIFEELQKHMLPSDMSELKTIVKEIETELAKSKKRFASEE